DHYLPASDEGAAATDKPAAGGAAPASESLLPVELLRGLNMAGHLRANQVILQQETLNNLVLRVEAQQGVLQVTQLSTELLQGNLNGRFVLDARGARPSLTSDVDINEIELTGISSRFMADSLLSGKASLTLDAKADGNTVDELLQSALGQLHLNLDQGVLHGVNLNAVVVDALRDKLSTVEYLYPDYQEKLPRQLRKDTEISKLIADAKVENGQLIMPKFEFFTGESGIDASGRIDLLEQGFDYQFGIVLSSIERNKYLKGTRWPVRCNGQLSGAPADWCRPDIKAMGSILSQAASKAIKDKGAAELGDKVGLEAEDREQLKDEVQEKLEAEEERAKRKLQDKLDKWLKR
ncbi:MAG: AsmA family protein, partial [Ketobacter sp.]